MKDWKPMETAPKNDEGKFCGPWILVWNDFNHGVYQVRWQYDDKGYGFWKGIGSDDFNVFKGNKTPGAWTDMPKRPSFSKEKP